MAATEHNTARLGFIDWTRGVAALVMLQGHTFNSFTRTDLRDKGPYMLSQFVGGLPPAIFLFLTGITFAFLMDSQDRKGGSSWSRILGALKRSRYLFLLAFLFRLQLYIFGYPTSPASEILRVDILNCMGLAMLVFAPMAVFTTLERARLCTVLGLVIAFLSPFVSNIDQNSVPWLIRSYFFPSYNTFGFFPWASFLAFGMVAGSVIRLLKHEELGKGMLWFLGVGLGLVMVSHSLSEMPYSIYTKSDYWLDGPGLTITKLGIVLALLAGAYLWSNAALGSRPSLVRQIGTTSLLVYWVHIELVYGRWFGFWKDALSVPQVLAYTACLIALMSLLSIAKTKWPEIWAFLRPGSLPEPRRASGD